MTASRRRTWRRTPWVIAPFLIMPFLVALAFPRGGAAQESPDFMLGRPDLTFGVRGGIAQPRQSSDLWSFVQTELTLDEDDFRSAAFGAELAWRATEHLDLALRLDYAATEASSEFREWVDLEDQPIEQQTYVRRRPITVNVKLFPVARGREISQFAWIPGGWSPYVGAGAGYVWWRFQQQGDFVDYDTLEIFTDAFDAEGSAPFYQVLGGIQVSLSPRLVLSTELNYGWAEGTLDGTGDGHSDYIGYEPLDLAGAGATVGLAVRF